MRDVLKKSELPLYNTMSNQDIAVLALSAILVFAVVSLRPDIPSSLKSLLIFLIPFCGFFYVCRGKLNLIVNHKFDLAYIVAYAILYYIFALASVTLWYYLGFPLKPNIIVNANKDALFWLVFFIQIFGEELFKLSMFFTALSILYKRASRIDNCSLAISVLFATFLFAAAHAHAYGGILQPLMIIGIGNIVLILEYVQSKNVVVPYVSHVIVDMIPLMATMFLFIC